jgi:hypothetical protein
VEGGYGGLLCVCARCGAGMGVMRAWCGCVACGSGGGGGCSNRTQRGVTSRLGVRQGSGAAAWPLAAPTPPRACVACPRPLRRDALRLLRRERRAARARGHPARRKPCVTAVCASALALLCSMPRRAGASRARACALALRAALALLACAALLHGAAAAASDVAATPTPTTAPLNVVVGSAAAALSLFPPASACATPGARVVSTTAVSDALQAGAAGTVRARRPAFGAVVRAVPPRDSSRHPSRSRAHAAALRAAAGRFRRRRRAGVLGRRRRRQQRVSRGQVCAHVLSFALIRERQSTSAGRPPRLFLHRSLLTRSSRSLPPARPPAQLCVAARGAAGRRRAALRGRQPACGAMHPPHQRSRHGITITITITAASQACAGGSASTRVVRAGRRARDRLRSGGGGERCDAHTRRSRNGAKGTIPPPTTHAYARTFS